MNIQFVDLMPANAVVVGNPARIIKSISIYPIEYFRRLRRLTQIRDV
jgi:hypothetical protein